MHRFWEIMIEPLLSALEPKILIEVGSARGLMTKQLAEYCLRNGGVLYAVDPAPEFDVEEFQRTYRDAFVFHKTLSLHALPTIRSADLVLIDGDHNWYTVFNELTLLSRLCRDAHQRFPVVLLHDTSWPYARRDMYYNPDTIPAEFLQMHESRGVIPGQVELAPTGGVNSSSHNALQEGGQKNGVLTAIEDFLAEDKHDLVFVQIPGFHGLGFLYESDLPENNPAFADYLRLFVPAEGTRSVMNAVEKARIDLYTKVIDLEKQLKALRDSAGRKDDLIRRKEAEYKLLQDLREKDLQMFRERSAKQRALLERKLSETEARLAKERSLHERLEKQIMKLAEVVRVQGETIVAKSSSELTEERARLESMVRDLERRQEVLQETLESLIQNLERRSGSVGSVLLESESKPVTTASEATGSTDTKAATSEPLKASEISTEGCVTVREKTLPAPSAPEVSIIILTFNALDSVKRCVESIFDFTDVPYELVIVDNGSADETRRYVESLGEIPGVKVILNGTNKGFAGGNNVGLRHAAAREIMFLNSDTLVTPNWLGNLRAALHSAPDVAAVGPVSNHASGIQGGIFLPSLTPTAVIDFARHYNFSDPYRWYDVDSLSGYALLVRKDWLDQFGGFDEKFAIGTAEDRDLCSRIRASGRRLICAADTFIFHEGHRSFLSNRIDFGTQNVENRRSLEGQHYAATGEICNPTNPPGEDQIVCTDGPEKFLYRNGTMYPIATHEAFRLLKHTRQECRIPLNQVRSYRWGETIFFVRTSGPSVYLVVAGHKHLLTGDQQRIRRLRGITVVTESELDALQDGEPICVTDKLEPVRAMKPLYPRSPLERFENRFLPLTEVVARLGAALKGKRGCSLVRLGSGEAIVLNQGIYQVNAFNTDYSGVHLPNHEFREQLITAVRQADIVGLSPNRDVFHCADLLELLFNHFHTYPKSLCSAYVNWELAGLNRDTGVVENPDPPLYKLLKGKRVAVVGRMAEALLRSGSRIGFDVSVHCGLEGAEEIEQTVEFLTENREKFDVLLASAGVPAVVLCSRIARHLNCVAIDFGHTLNRILNANFSEKTLGIEKEKWRIEQYIKQHKQSSFSDTAPHPLAGRICRTEKGHYYYIERNIRRYIPNLALVDYLQCERLNVRTEDIQSLPLGAPMCIVQERLGSPYLLKDGRKIPVKLGLRFFEVADGLLDALPLEDRVVEWFPRVSLPRTAKEAIPDSNGRLRTVFRRFVRRTLAYAKTG